MSAVLVDTSMQNIEGAFQKISQLILQTAQKYNVHDAPHPKHAGDPNHVGTGVHHGVAQILPQHEANPGLVFREADTKLELNKRNKQNVNGNKTMPAGTNAPTQQRQVQGQGVAGEAGSRLKEIKEEVENLKKESKNGKNIIS
jgi:hypothetical protein